MWFFRCCFVAFCGPRFLQILRILALEIREIPPGLLQHVLTVLVFWSWVLLLPRLPPWSRSLRLFPWASIYFTGPWTLLGSAARSSPFHLCKNGTHSTCFYSTGGTRRIIFGLPRKHKVGVRTIFWVQNSGSGEECRQFWAWSLGV